MLRPLDALKLIALSLSAQPALIPLGLIPRSPSDPKMCGNLGAVWGPKAAPARPRGPHPARVPPRGAPLLVKRRVRGSLNEGVPGPPKRKNSDGLDKCARSLQ
jgi:hypothetical protein